MLYFSKIFKIREGKLDRVKEWMHELSGPRKQEAEDTFVFENVNREVVAIFEGEDGSSYLIGLNEANADYKSGDLSVKINQEHASFKKECLEPITKKGEVVLDLSK